MTRSHGLRGEPAFVRWASAEGISLVGSAVTTIVLPLVVFEATGSITQTGALYAVRVVPYLLFGFLAGPIADQGNRRFLIIGGNVAEGLLVAFALWAVERHLEGRRGQAFALGFAAALIRPEAWPSP